MDNPLVDALAPELFALVMLRHGVDAEYRDLPDSLRAGWRQAAEQILGRLGQIDVILPDGTHRYYSTHCRHGRHEDCSSSTMPGTVTIRIGQVVTPPEPVQIERNPAQCKTCASPCICPCHKEASSG